MVGITRTDCIWNQFCIFLWPSYYRIFYSLCFYRNLLWWKFFFNLSNAALNLQSVESSSVQMKAKIHKMFWQTIYSSTENYRKAVKMKLFIDQKNCASMQKLSFISSTTKKKSLRNQWSLNYQKRKKEIFYQAEMLFFYAKIKKTKLYFSYFFLIKRSDPIPFLNWKKDRLLKVHFFYNWT